jgi:anti-anti-sigma factor
MTVTTERSGDIVVIHAGPVRLTYPSLADFAGSVTGELAAGARKLVIDLGKVEYLDSAAVGCLMDLYRQASAGGATIKLAAVQRRVETLLTLTGANQFYEIYPDSPSAIKSF